MTRTQIETMTYEVVESKQSPHEWIVEAINYAGEGEVYFALFSGPLAEERAGEYAEWKNGGGGKSF